MAHLQLLCVIFTITLGAMTCSGQTTTDSTLPSMVREVEDNSRYKTLEANATLLKLLVDNKDGVSRSEVFDMLHSRDENVDHIDLPTFPEDAEDERLEVPASLEAQAESLQGPGVFVRKDMARPRVNRGEPYGAAAGIMILITCTVVCAAYTGLVVWRKIYLKRNGLKHELLRNDDNVAETRIEL